MPSNVPSQRYSDKSHRIWKLRMVTFLLYWGFLSLAGTLFALSLIWSGKRNSSIKKSAVGNYHGS
ncbi:MAG: hypothetical protein JWQ69_2243 [Pseudomonas sp.]|nr:hypothetical protein [Pseudomonas sp.]